MSKLTLATVRQPVVRERVLAVAVQEGRLNAEATPDFRSAYDKDPFGTMRLIEGLAPQATPSAPAGPKAAAKDEYPSAWLPEVGRPANRSRVASDEERTGGQRGGSD